MGFNLTDYNEYKMKFREKIKYFSAAAVVIFILVFIFYHNLFLSVILCTLAFFYPRMKTRKIIENRKYNLNLQFKDVLYSLSSSLNAGKSVEVSFREIYQDLSIIYNDPETDILTEVLIMNRKLEMNETIESVLSDFAQRTHIEDVSSFVEVFKICKRTGGNIIEVIKNTSNIINDKIEIKDEINIILSERRLEQRILNLLPIFMIILLTFTVPEYINPVFTDTKGLMAMSLSILLLAIAYFISGKIVQIDV